MSNPCFAKPPPHLGPQNAKHISKQVGHPWACLMRVGEAEFSLPKGGDVNPGQNRPGTLLLL